MKGRRPSKVCSLLSNNPTCGMLSGLNRLSSPETRIQVACNGHSE